MALDALVVGGGIAGLSCAWRLHQAGLEVQLLEAAAACGGNVRSRRVEGFLLERGPHTFRPSADDVFALAREVGADDAVIASRPAAKKRFIARGQRLHKVFTGPGSFLASRLLSWKGKWKLMGEPFRTRQRGQPSDDAATFFTRRFGPEAARVLAGAFISGVYAGDPRELSAPAAFSLFWKFEQEHGSMIRGAMRHTKEAKRARRARGDTAPRPRGLCSLREGLGQLTGAVARKLGDACRTNTAARAAGRDGNGFVVECERESFRARRLVVAVPPAEAAAVLRPLDAGLAALLASIPMAPMAVVHTGYARRAEQVPDGFGFLVPRGEGIRTLGILFPSRLFEGRVPQEPDPQGGDLFTAYVGGMLDQAALDLDDQELAGIARGDLEILTGFSQEPRLVEVARHRHAIPQFTHGHLERMAALHQRRRNLEGLELAGNYLRGVGMKDAVASGFASAAALLEARGSAT